MPISIKFQSISWKNNIENENTWTSDEQNQ